MSRRRGEFEHRTSIFEGAFRAWSHLGGLEPLELENKPSADLDPLSNPIENDDRLLGKKESKAGAVNANGTKRRQFPYEPLPRSGLSHPYVQAILSPWLGPDADNDAIQLGLTTLRTWWQHRRKGESGSATAALGTEKMKGVVEGYTRHFFTLAHCLIINDKEQPPRSLHSKMKELEKVRGKRKKKRTQNSDNMNEIGLAETNDSAGDILNNKNLSPLERLHIAQQRQLSDGGGIGGIQTIGGTMGAGAELLPIIHIKNKCVPGKPDLPGIVDKVTRAASQLAHSGGGRSSMPSVVLSSGVAGFGHSGEDTNSIPIVYISESRDVMIAMTVDGITCAHCVKIVETVLRGCNGNKSPIDGLLDAAADRTLNAILIRIDRTTNARRIALEAARNLAMVGYTALAKTMSSIVETNGNQSMIPHEEFDKGFDILGEMDPRDIFDWSAPCSCPDNGVARDDCARHGQMNSALLEAFEGRAIAVRRYLSGEIPQQKIQLPQQIVMNNQFQQQGQAGMINDVQSLNDANGMGMVGMGMGMDMFGGIGGGMENLAANMNGGHLVSGGGGDLRGSIVGSGNMRIQQQQQLHLQQQLQQQNQPVMSFGNHRMSLMGQLQQNPDQRMSLMGRMSHVSYGRAMSGLSALSIDWENMDDFDVNVDHSQHINNSLGAAGAMGRGNRGPRVASRSSMRVPSIQSGTDNDEHVQFKL